MTTSSTAASALASLLADPPSWLPPVNHWEVAEDTDSWILSGQLAGEMPEAPAFRLLAPLMEIAETPHSDDGRLVKVPFTWEGVAVQVWYLRPIERWIVPERCVTCPTELGAPDVSFVRLGEGREASVVCVPCRDRMHAEWVSTICPASEDRKEHNWWFSLPDDGWRCTVCKAVRKDASDPATAVRAAVVR